MEPNEYLHGAKWIADGTGGAPESYAPIFRRTFSIEKKPEKAVLQLCGLGFHDAKINAKPVTLEKLAPAFTDYSKRVFLSEYDVTGLLKTGENALAIELGRSFYAMNTKNVWSHEKSGWHAEPKLICCLSLYAEDGTACYIVSDERFRSRAGAAVRACLYTGETIDGNIADQLAGWELPDYDDSEWKPAVLAEAPAGKLVVAEGPPILEKAEYSPVRIERTKPDTQIVTFPYNISGWCHIRAKGKPGQTIQIKYGEVIRENGSVQVVNDYIEHPSQVDSYILGQSGMMDWEPKFSYKGFQYVEVIGEIDDLRPEDVIAKLVVADVPLTAEFYCSVPLLNQIYEIVCRTMQNNLHSIPTDTPVYEKNGWIGDAGLMGEAFVTVFDIPSLYQKWLTDMEDCMTEAGQLPVIVPTAIWGFMYSPEWCDCPFELVWQLYLHSGDISLLKRYYPMLQKQAAFGLTNLNEQGVPNSVLWDWVPPGYPEGAAPEGPGVTAPCYLRKSLLTLERIAVILGDRSSAADYHEKAEMLARAMNRNCFRQEQDCYETERGGYRQVNNILPAAMGLVPDGKEQAVVDRLVQDIREKGDHLDTGIIGTKYLLPLLSDHGYHELAYTLATQTTYPSWGHWVVNGMNTCLEAWEMAARSRNHYMLGTILDWLWRYIAGFRIEEAGCGKIIIAPRPVGELKFCRWKLKTVKGVVSAEWQITDGEFVMNVALPDGIEAKLILPNGETQQICEAQTIMVHCKI